MIQVNRSSSPKVVVDGDEYRVDEISLWTETDRVPSIDHKSVIVTGDQFLRLRGRGEVPSGDANTVLVPRKNLELAVEGWSTEASIAVGREYEWTVEYLVVEETKTIVPESSLTIDDGMCIEGGFESVQLDESDESSTITDYLSE